MRSVLRILYLLGSGLAVGLAGLMAIAAYGQTTATQTFANPYYTSVVCLRDGTFQNGEFDFIHYENGVAKFYKFFAYAPSNLNHEQPQLEVLGIMPLTDGAEEANPPSYTFSAGTLPSAELAFTIQGTRCCGFKAVNVTASLTRSN